MKYTKSINELFNVVKQYDNVRHAIISYDIAQGATKIEVWRSPS